jgi:predicted site-specific integrase-resolvase
LLTVGQAARSAGVTPASIRLWDREGKLAVVRSPYGRLIDPDELAKTLQRREREHAPAEK